MGLVHSEQSLRNAKASLASISNAVNEGSEDDGEDVDSEHSSEVEGDECLEREFYSDAEDISKKIKSLYKEAMKEPVIEDPIHKKIASFYKDNLKLHHMQLLTLQSDMRSMHTMVEETKGQQERLFEDRLLALSMKQMNKRLREESQLSNMITKVEERMSAMEKTLHALVQGNIQTNNLLQ